VAKEMTEHTGLAGVYQTVIGGLRANATLASLATHTTTNLRIGREMPITAKSIPYVSVAVAKSMPQLVDVPDIISGKLCVSGYHSNSKDCTILADAIQAVFNTAMSDNRAYFNPSGGVSF
jgi:hypothetical protein